MSDAEWQEVSDRFSGLAEQFKAHYKSEEEGEETQDVKDALRSLGDAADRVANSVGNALRDPAVKEQAKDAVNSLLGALSGTFSELGDEFNKLFGRETDEAAAASHDDDLAQARQEIREAAGDVRIEDEPEPEGEPTKESSAATADSDTADEGEAEPSDTDADTDDGSEDAAAP